MELCFSWWVLLVTVVVFWVVPEICQGQPSLLQPRPYSFNDLLACDTPSVELSAADRTTPIDPCILYDTYPGIDALSTTSSNTNSINNSSETETSTTTIVVVGVFNSAAGIHRDGGLVAAKKLNEDNDGRGAAIGYYGDHYVKFRLVVGIAGNRDNLGTKDYEQAHQTMLQVLLEDLKPQYIFGTSSFESDLEREIAGLYQTMLLAQVGPQSYYTSNRSNDHVFGSHIPSDGYGIPAFQALRFNTRRRSGSLPQNSQREEDVPIRIIYRDRSEFFYSTCRAVYSRAVEEGFNNSKVIEYNPDGDEDQDGDLNHEDEDFLQGLADQACSAEEAGDGIALWGCFLTDMEVDTVLQRLRDNGCRLSMIWLTVASWAWPYKNPDVVPYMQSGGQWHLSMAYSDEYFSSGQAMLAHMSEEFGYNPSYAALGAYHSIYLMYQNIRSFFKGKDQPEVAETFADPERYEELRRSMMDLSLPHTLYGPTSFDEHRRNAGRGSAGMQWDLPDHSTSANFNPENGNDDGFELLLVSPVDQATSAVIFPAPAFSDCPEGSFINQTHIHDNPDLLGSKCALCPADTYKDGVNADYSCQVCSPGSGTDNKDGATVCIELDDNLISDGLIIFGYCIAALVFCLATGFAIWTIKHRNDPVVRIGQMEFLLLICLGPFFSSSCIIALSIQAGSLEDETAATRACMALPWLYTTGWMLQYGSLSAKSYRMYQTMKAAEAVQGSRLGRKTVTACDMYKIIFMLLMLNWAIVIPWTILDPLGTFLSTR